MPLCYDLLIACVQSQLVDFTVQSSQFIAGQLYQKFGRILAESFVVSIVCVSYQALW